MMGDGMVSQGSMIVKPNAMKLRRIISKTGGSSSPSSSSSSEEDKDSDADKIVTLVGFAGSTADAFTLLERLEGKLDEYPGQLARSCVELAKGWRTDKYLRRLEASLIVADATCSLELTGNGDVLESHDGVLGVGSGSPYAIGTYRDQPPAAVSSIVMLSLFVFTPPFFVRATYTSLSFHHHMFLFLAAARALMDIPELSAEDVAKKAMRVASDMCVYTNDNYRVEVIKTNDEDTKAEKDEEEKTSP
jgi:ATP-dependent HslUV protease subunit HslV